MKGVLPLTNNVLNLAIKKNTHTKTPPKNPGGFSEVLFVEPDLMPR